MVSPPPFALEDDRDETVPVGQSVTFAERLRAVGVPVQLEIVTGADHSLNLPGQSQTPQQLVTRMVDFLAAKLKA